MLSSEQSKQKLALQKAQTHLRLLLSALMSIEVRVWAPSIRYLVWNAGNAVVKADTDASWTAICLFVKPCKNTFQQEASCSAKLPPSKREKCDEFASPQEWTINMIRFPKHEKWSICANWKDFKNINFVYLVFKAIISITINCYSIKKYTLTSHYRHKRHFVGI